MKIGFYSPYFDVFGGGERYMLTLASHLSHRFEVDIFWNDSNILLEASKRFSLDLTKIHIVNNIFYENNLFNKFIVSRKYDLMVILSDGSIPLSFARRNLLHFQVPFPQVKYPIWKKMIYHKIVCNSQFTKNSIDQSVGKNAIVICPPVNTHLFIPGKKISQILSVGRFSPNYQVKKSAFLIKAFRKLRKISGLKNIKLAMVGSLGVADQKYFTHLKDLARGIPVKFFPNCDISKLKELYSESLIYWHAAGFGESDPMYMEHFGISSVESMSSGCIPVVYKAGGQLEIIDQGINGFLWTSEAELLNITSKIINNPSVYNDVSLNAIKRSADFDTSVFTKQFDLVIADLFKS
jgi:O-antigen biosynthesis protein